MSQMSRAQQAMTDSDALDLQPHMQSYCEGNLAAMADDRVTQQIEQSSQGVPGEVSVGPEIVPLPISLSQPVADVSEVQPKGKLYDKQPEGRKRRLEARFRPATEFKGNKVKAYEKLLRLARRKAIIDHKRATSRDLTALEMATIARKTSGKGAKTTQKGQTYA